jgi:hypothetical protein
MVKLAEVVTLYDSNARTPIPDQMRIAADTIESETDDNDKTVAMVFVQLHESGDVQVVGIGDTDELHSLGCLTRALAKLAAGEYV